MPVRHLWLNQAIEAANAEILQAALQEDRDACFAAGMDDYVAKPIRPEALAEALRKAQPLAAG